MDKAWKPFKITDFFTPVRGREGNMAGLTSGDIPLVSARNVNNGMKGFVSNPNSVIAGDVITLNNDGDGGAGLAYYQPLAMALDTHVTALVPKKKMDANSQLYTACCLSGLHEFFGHGRSISNGRVSNIKVMLPTDTCEDPDWDYMSAYVKSLKTNLLARYKRYVEEQLSKLEFRDIPKLDEVEWKPVNVSDVFTEIERGKRLKKADHIKGDTPYVSSTAMNNGVDAFISASPGTRVFSNCISLANSGSVGTAFFEPYAFVASDHVTHLKREGFSKWIYLFLATMVQKQGVNFNFNREINDVRIKKMQIMLPVAGDGEPDYAYMEQYAKNLMFKKYQQYLAYLKRQAK